MHIVIPSNSKRINIKSTVLAAQNSNIGTVLCCNILKLPGQNSNIAFFKLPGIFAFSDIVHLLKHQVQHVSKIKVNQLEHRWLCTANLHPASIRGSSQW